MALDAVPSSATFDSYTTVAEADIYHSMRLHNPEWAAASTPTKEAALKWATKNFEKLNWKGFRTVVGQKFMFPRNMLFRDGEEYGYGADAIYNTYMFDPATIPDFLKDATAELAFWLIKADTTAPIGTEGFKKLGIGSGAISIELDKTDRLDWLYDSVRDIIYRYLLNPNPYVASTMRV